MILAYRGKWEVKWLRKKASTAFSANTLVSDDASGEIKPAEAADTSVIGIIMKDVTSSDSDYADNTRVLVLVPTGSDCEILADTNSDIAVTDEGEYHDLTDASTVNPASSANDIVRLVKYVSARKGIYTINAKAIK